MPACVVDKRELIARRVAQELRDGYCVNLGIGTPTLVANYIPPGMEVVFQIVNEMKPRVAKTEEVLKTFENVEGLPIPDNATFLLYLRGGVPERLIVDTIETKPDRFLLNGKFRAV